MERVIKFRLYCQMKEGLRKYAVTDIKYKRYGEREISKIHVGDMVIDGEYLKDGLAHLVQFTGLTDRNGVEIYEGDIVLYNRNIGKTIDKYKYVVKYSIDKYILDHNFSEVENGITWDMVEVIGNIYENSDLLATTQP